MEQQDASQIPYGALDYYQVHYIVEVNNRLIDTVGILAKCTPITTGHFRKKRIVDVKWTGEKLARILENDLELKEMLKTVLTEEGEIKIDPLDDHIRIYGKWKNEDQLRFNNKTFEAVERIAGHIKNQIKDQ
jgi:hypothetical protein